MKLEITKKSVVADVQKEFSDQYPSLKIEFYAQKPVDGMNTKEALSGDSSFKKEAVVSIEKERTVSDFEADFLKEAGVAVQVFRKSGNIWLQTTRTDDWTLEKQNLQGSEEA